MRRPGPGAKQLHDYSSTIVALTTNTIDPKDDKETHHELAKELESLCLWDDPSMVVHIDWELLNLLEGGPQPNT